MFVPLFRPLQLGEIFEFIAGNTIQCRAWASTARIHIDCLYYNVTNHIVDQESLSFLPELATEKHWLGQHIENPTIFLDTRPQVFTARGVGAELKFHGWRVSLSNRQPVCNDNSGRLRGVFVSVQAEHKQLATSTLRNNKMYG